MGRLLKELPKAVIFDVDGTLYDQPRLRRKMCRELAVHCIRSPMTGLGTIKTLAVFRRLRESMPTMEVVNVAHTPYAMTAQRLNSPLEHVRRIVHEWMFHRPLRHLPSCKFPGLDSFLEHLTMRGVATAVFSDYPAQAKTQSMGLTFSLLLDAEDERVDRLKPDPKGLIVCSELLNLDTAECLFVGDRDDRDGECARRAGMPYFLYSKSSLARPNMFRSYGELLESFR
ncbi:HAD family hydrolase [Desulfonatronum lacustre]|uniref:HAD family hydrolase n=1 Tax=Desulfonatronum lacustre TaxID=66849 RepID=UPI0004B78B51|nr:HAD family hydrolase [Desulfonatronum lacustre]